MGGGFRQDLTSRTVLRRRGRAGGPGGGLVRVRFPGVLGGGIRSVTGGFGRGGGRGSRLRVRVFPLRVRVFRLPVRVFRLPVRVFRLPVTVFRLRARAGLMGAAEGPRSGSAQRGGYRTGLGAGRFCPSRTGR
jgi:hypothetical protein